MLSILIPVYQVDVRPLVERLLAEAADLPIPVEINLLDDASGAPWIEQYRTLPADLLVRIEVLSENVGRARIRNLLAEQARYPYLLFLDADVMPLRPDFIREYLTLLPTNQVLCGGLAYSPVVPPSERRLRWHYGRQREVVSVVDRFAHPYEAFKTSNFAMPRDRFLAIGFRETIRAYGHEDTLFGADLAERNLPIFHLDNPVVHLGLETNEVFLAKTKEAIANLVALKQQGVGVPSRLGRTYARFKSLGLAAVLALSSTWLVPMLEKRLLRYPYQIRILDVIKLLHYSRLMHRLVSERR
ncbi:MAG: glycosyltransferase [Lewinellaceae bacterium]|nr:glycosyltransferase [Lewinellaceae bacterium]